MTGFNSIKKAPIEIGNLLASNKKLVSLIYDDTNNPTNSDISFSDLLKDRYINIYPPINDGNIDDFNRNTYIVILLDSINPNNESNIQVNCVLYVVTDVNLLMLTENRNRLLECVDEIYKTLDNHKLTASGEIEVNYINYITIDPHKVGYRISLNFTEQVINKAEI